MTVSKMFLTVASVVKVWSGLGRFLVKVNERLHSLEKTPTGNRPQYVMPKSLSLYAQPSIPGSLTPVEVSLGNRNNLGQDTTP